jgi:hypothetical protein
LSTSVPYNQPHMGTIDLTELLDRAGIKVGGLDRIRLARGVVGKSSYVALSAMLALAVAAWGLKGNAALLSLAGIILFLFVVYFVGIIRFANRNPGLALLEGAELIQWRQMEISAQGMPAQVNTQLTTPPLPIEPE